MNQRTSEFGGAVSLTLTDGEVIALDDDRAVEVLDNLKDDDTIVIRSRVYATDAHHRKPVRISESALDSVVATAINKPIMDIEHAIHGGDETSGTILAADHEGGDVFIDHKVFGAQYLSDLKNGIQQQYSIAVTDTANTTRECSECGLDPFDVDGDCEHMPGWDGSHVIYGGEVETSEVTRTYVPAVQGTGIEGIVLTSATLDATDEVAAMVIKKAQAKHKPAKVKEPALVVEPVEPETSPELTAALEQAAALKIQLAGLQGKMALDRAELAVLDARKLGKFANTSVENMVQLHVDSGPELAQRWIDACQPDPTMTAIVLSGAGGTAPYDSGATWQTRLAQASMEMANSPDNNHDYGSALIALYEKFQPEDEKRNGRSGMRRQIEGVE